MSYSYNTAGGAAALIIWFIVMIAFWVGVSWLMYWKVFEKAGKEPWKALIPIYQFYVIILIVGRPVWWFWIIVGCYIGMLIPILNFIAWIPLFVMVLLIALDMARCFGKSNGFGIGLWLLSIIFYPILGFGDAQYQGPLAAAGAQAGGGGYAQPTAPPPVQPMGQAMDRPMAPAHVPWQSVPPVPGPAAQQMTPPPPLAQPLQPRPLTPPPAQVAPPTPPPAQVAPPAPPPAEAAPPAAETAAPTQPSVEAEAAVEAAEAAPAEVETVEVEAAPAQEAPPESPTPPPPPVS